jgi:di/tricarboxylate transporter
VTVAAMFVLSAGLQKSGALAGLGKSLNRLGGSSTVLLAVMMGTVGFVSAFINNTAAVAVFLPLILGVAAARKMSASKLLIPLSYASQFGGVCTLIGTSTNLLVSSISERAGIGAFSMFEFSKLGVLMFIAGFAYLLLLGRWLVPERRGGQLTENFRLGGYVTELRVMPESPLIGKSVEESKLAETHDVTVLELIRDKRKVWVPLGEPLAEGDLLLVRGKVKDLVALRNREKLEIEPEFKLRDEELEDDDLQLAEAFVPPRSRLIGHTLSESDFHWRY